jgi:XTP/dITP diphosphohydrolase
MSAAGRVLLATRSDDKLREIRLILAPFSRATLLSLNDVGIPEAPAEADIETHDTFLANAHAKADYFRRLSGLATIADDSGIVVDALDGRPGVLSRRFAASASAAAENLTGYELDRANNETLLLALRDVAPADRTAHYTCAAVLHRSDGQRTAALGTCHGVILTAPRGSLGFGYDPLFLDPDSGLSFGETDPAIKNATSHRSRAFRALAANLHDL